jgi:hypothetical protein
MASQDASEEINRILIETVGRKALWFSNICLPVPTHFGVKKAAFWGVSARAHTPKCEGLSPEFSKSQRYFLAQKAACI